MRDVKSLLDIDLEEYRIREGLTYEELKVRLGLRQSRQAQAYALGETWPKSTRLQQIIERTNGSVSILAMHRRRLAWLRRHGGSVGRVPALLVDAPQAEAVGSVRKAG